MCGIIAALGVDDITQEVAAIAHRGLRSRIVQKGEGVIGHVRLPIVGLGEKYDQPVEEDDFLIAFVGEILDFRDHDPSAESDLPVVINAWRENGQHGFEYFDGFWSVVVIENDAIHVLCDYLAQKPMYYRAEPPMVASELDPLRLNYPVTPDEIYFSSVIKWGYCPETWRTPFREIRRVLPGEYVVIGYDGGLRKSIVDTLTARDPGSLRTEIELAVKRRVVASDVPVAVLVSGGLDSSIVYTLAKKYGPVVPYYVSEENVQTDLVELLAVSAVLGKNPYNHVTWKSVTAANALRTMQEPIDLGSLIPQVALASQIVERVCLTGDGADEFFGGYGRSMRYDSQASDVYHELVAWHLPRLDRVMMKRSIEVRSPFLARRVAECALGLPWSKRRDKNALREMFAEELPPGVANTPKRPLRTIKIEGDREGNSRKLVDMFRKYVWP